MQKKQKLSKDIEEFLARGGSITPCRVSERKSSSSHEDLDDVFEEASSHIEHDFVVDASEMF